MFEWINEQMLKLMNRITIKKYEKDFKNILL
jgi:hypothetical protein